MEGYPVVTTEKKRVGHVVDVRDDYYIIESGAQRKARYPLPKRYASVDSLEGHVLIQVSKETLCGGPRIGPNGTLDEGAVAAYYGD